jgi:hypothetical protein
VPASAGGFPLLGAPSFLWLSFKRDESVTGSGAEALAGDAAPAACTGVRVAAPATVQVTAGTAEVIINAQGKTKKTGAPGGVRIDILPAGAAAGAAADPACSIPVRGAIKAGATRARKIAAKKLAACYNALKLADCTKPLQARATAIAGKKFKEGLASALVTFTPECTPCAGRASLEQAPAQQAQALAPAQQAPAQTEPPKAVAPAPDAGDGGLTARAIAPLLAKAKANPKAKSRPNAKQASAARRATLLKGRGAGGGQP